MALTRNSSKTSRLRRTPYHYSCFLKKCHEEHNKKHPDEEFDFPIFSRNCAERWKTMSEKEKKRFQEMADRDKNPYELKTRKAKDAKVPERSLPAFIFFGIEKKKIKKKLNKEYDVLEFTSVLGNEWTSMGTEMKRKYEVMSQRDKGNREIERELKDYLWRLKSKMTGV